MIKMTVVDTDGNMDSAKIKHGQLPITAFEAFTMYLSTQLESDRTKFTPMDSQTILDIYNSLNSVQRIKLSDDSCMLLADDESGPLIVIFKVL